MSNLTAGTRPRLYGKGGRRVLLPVQALAQLWEGAMVSEINGAVVTGTTASAGPCIGVAENDMLGGATDGAVRVAILTDQIFIFNAGTNAPTDATTFGTPLFMETDNTVGTGAAGQQQVGRFMGMEDDGTVRVFISVNQSWFDALSAVSASSGGSSPFKARAVVTSLHAYTGTTTGTLTSTANGAFGTQDSLATLAVGDVVFIPAGTANLSAASDSGPYVISVIGNSSPGAKWVLTRPSWWLTGATMVTGTAIEIQEGTQFAGNAYKNFSAKGKVVDTDDPLFWERNFKKIVTLGNSQGNYTIGFGGGNEIVGVRSATASSVQCTLNTPGGTLSTNKIGAVLTQGVFGTGAIVVQAYLDNGGNATTDTSTVNVLLTNW